MKLARLGAPGAEIPAYLTDHAAYDLRGLTDDLDGSFFAADGIARVREVAAAGGLPVLDGAATMRTGPPLARPSAVLCIGTTCTWPCTARPQTWCTSSLPFSTNETSSAPMRRHHLEEHR